MSNELGCSILNCRLCSKTNLSKILKLKSTPAGNNFLTEEELSLNFEPIFPLELFFCEDCFHIQLGYVVSPKHLFKNYHFVSGTSHVNVNHFDEYAESIITQFDLNEGSFILDIGSNDGTCLQAFKKRGMKVLGVDPAENIAQVANQNGIETLPEFFSDNLAAEIRLKYGVPDLITSHNVLAHIEDFQGTMKAISSIMNDESIFVFEVGYFREVFKNLYFDTIYHEHLDYHTLSPLVSFFNSINMELFDSHIVNIQGGSLRNFVQLTGGRNETKTSVSELIAMENKQGLDNIPTLRSFQKSIDEIKTILLSKLIDLKKEGKIIAGYGAPTKSTTLMSYFNIDNEIIDFIVDDNPLKQNKFSPKLHIPVVSSDYLIGDSQPDYLLILAWNFAESIIDRVNENFKYSGKFIVPLPKVKIVNGSG